MRTALPADVQNLLVASLFKDSRSLIFGAVTTVAAIAVTAARNHTGSLWICLGVFASVVTARLLLNAAYEKLKSPGRSLVAAERWERGYAVGAGLHGLVLGFWCLLCLKATDDTFAQLLSAVVTVGCASAIPGRNFGRVGIATVQILGLCIPLCLGWALKEDWSYAALTLLSLPFFASLRIMTVRLQATLLDALTTNNKLGTLAERFDAALTNMPLGLCMLDQRGDIEVFNSRLADILGLAEKASLHGAAFTTLLPPDARHSNGSDPLMTPAGHMGALLAEGARSSLSLDLQDGRTITLTSQPMSNGGAVVLAEDVTLRRQSERHIVHLARFDLVTGIANRSYFLDEMGHLLKQAQDAGVACALHFIDLDRFKLVNDTLGHICGDLLLREVALRMQNLAGRRDIVGRFGGDEFVILQFGVQDVGQAEELASALVAELAKPFSIAGNPVKIGASVGVMFEAKSWAGADLMIQRADLALYRAKTDGRGRWAFFKPAMDLERLQRRTLERDLGEALEAWSFELYFQPLFMLDDMQIATCEALLRWRHPLRGMISPAEFIPIAEELGLISELGDRVLHAACATCSTWPGQTSVAVNLSSVQFERGDIVATVRHALAESGLDPRRLQLEITESVLLQNTQATHAVLESLRDMGVQVVLDDFGTGHSNLAYLHSFPLQKVKLDRSFLTGIVEGERSHVLLKGVCDLSRQLGLTVVVEGVETDTHLRLVRGLGSVDEVQGFLLGRPMPEGDTVRLLDRFARVAPSERPETAAAARDAIVEAMRSAA